MNYVTPVGFRDVVSEEALVREELTSRVRACFAARGYLPVETPTLEVLDVMEAGGHVPEAPFKFFDSHGDLLAMRPDVTMQIARMCAARSDSMGGLTKPIRLRYTQRVFREKTVEAAARELTQCGAECLGVAGGAGDVELIGMFAHALEECGLTRFTIALGSAGVLRELLRVSDASDQWQAAVLQAYHTSNFVYLGELVDAAQGSTTKDKNTEGKNFKLSDPALDNPGKVHAEVARAIFALSRLRGGKKALDEVRALLEPFGCEAGIAELEAVYNTLVASGLGDKLLIDFSVMSSFDYYTGLVFEAYAPGVGSPLGGGGRYDNLLASYGAEKIPAAGFAFYLEQVMAARQAAAQQAAFEAEQKAVQLQADETAGLISERADQHQADKRVDRQQADQLVRQQGEQTVLQQAGDQSGRQANETAAQVNCAATRPLRIAVPKGSLKEGAVEVLKNAGLDVEGLLDSGRTLMLRNGDVEYLIVRPTDAPVFVSLGAADCGICGEDSLLEAAPDVVELVDLKFGGCRFVVAESKGTTEAVEERYRKLGSIRVATKYPNITRSYYAKIGMPVEIVKLHGNIELAPITGMAERIVDITATGTTLRENNLVVVDDVLASTARFFANPSSFRTNPRVGQLADTLYKQAKEN